MRPSGTFATYCSGWHAARVSGHDIPALAATLRSLRAVEDKPKVVIADTVKGKGVKPAPRRARR